jgi:hypothetical protein
MTSRRWRASASTRSRSRLAGGAHLALHPGLFLIDVIQPGLVLGEARRGVALHGRGLFDPP